MTTARIRELNDRFRQSFSGGRIMVTPGVVALGDSARATILRKVRDDTEFTRENDPHKEHDFGVIKHAGNKLFWKIDYYDPALEYGSDDPADPSKTTRVLTIMLAEEY